MSDDDDRSAPEHHDVAAPPAESHRGGTPADQLDRVLVQSRELGFLGPGPIGPQRAHARSFLGPLDGAARALDLGSGGGLPGLVVAWEMPDIELVLLDGMSRRCDFLELAVDELGLGDRVTVICGRAEELARRSDLAASFPVVMARSFGAPAVLAECAVGFLAGVGSRLLVSEPPSSSAERWPDAGLLELGLARGEVSRGHGGTIQELLVVGERPEKYPRRVGIPAKRPIF